MEPMMGQLLLFCGTFAPRGFSNCDGQILTTAEFPALFSILSNQFGGDGRNTFGVPDLRGRMVVGSGAGPGLSIRMAGEKGGVEWSNLRIDQMPEHSHEATFTPSGEGGGDADVQVSTSAGKESVPAAGSYLGTAQKTGPGGGVYSQWLKPGDKGATVSLGGVTGGGSSGGTVEIGPTGDGAPFALMNPFTVVKYILAVDGGYPSRP